MLVIALTHLDLLYFFKAFYLAEAHILWLDPPSPLHQAAGRHKGGRLRFRGCWCRSTWARFWTCSGRFLHDSLKKKEMLFGESVKCHMTRHSLSRKGCVSSCKAGGASILSDLKLTFCHSSEVPASSWPYTVSTTLFPPRLSQARKLPHPSWRGTWSLLERVPPSVCKIKLPFNVEKGGRVLTLVL